MDDYFKRAIPEPFRILGLALKPLSLGRYRLLERFECAFVAEEEKTATVSDLILGCVICSMEVDAFLEALQSRALLKAVRRWGRKVCPLPWLGIFPGFGRWWRARHSFNVVEKVGLFKSYIRRGSEMPLYWSEDDEGRSSGGHWSQAVEVTLRGKLGWTPREINEAPLSKAIADYFKYAESQGMITLMTPDEIAQVRAAEEEEARKAGHSAFCTLHSELEKPEVSHGP